MIKDIKNLFAQTWNLTLRRKYRILIAVFCVVMATIALLPFDKSFLSIFLVAENSPAEDVARFISCWGDFQTGTCITVLLLFLMSKIFKKENLKHVAIACLLSAITAGMIGNVLCFTTGRPRPNTNMKDSIHLFNAKPAFHSFPSGHSATAFGTAVPLAIAYPVTAIPVLGAATSVAWARIALNRHYPSDILVGIFLGILIGILFGIALRKNFKPEQEEYQYKK